LTDKPVQTEIDDLRAENERLRTGKQHWQDVAARLNTENERLRTAQEEATRLLAQVMRGYANQPVLYADLNHVRGALAGWRDL